MHTHRPSRCEPRRRLPAAQGGRELETQGIRLKQTEVLIKVVMFVEPKLLSGSDQKVCGQVQGVSVPLPRMLYHRPRSTTFPLYGHEEERSKIRSPPSPIRHWGGTRVRKKRFRGGGSGMREQAKALR